MWGGTPPLRVGRKKRDGEATTPLAAAKSRMGGERIRFILQKACKLLGVDAAAILEAPRDDSPAEGNAMTGILSAVRSHAAIPQSHTSAKCWEPDGDMYTIVNDWVADKSTSTPLVFWLDSTGQVIVAEGSAYTDRVVSASGIVYFIKNPAARTLRTQYQYGFVPWAYNRSEFVATLFEMARGTVARGMTVGEVRTRALEACNEARGSVDAGGIKSPVAMHSERGAAPPPPLQTAKTTLSLDATLQSVHDPHFSFDKAGLQVVRYVKLLLAKYVDADCTIVDEVRFWQFHAQEIIAMLHELQTSEVVAAIAEGLRTAHSPVYPVYVALLTDLQNEAHKRLEWVYHLTPVAEDFRNLAAINMALDHRLMAKAFDEIFVTIQCLTESSDYCTPARLVCITARFADKLQELSEQHLLSEGGDRVAEVRRQIEVLCLFKAAFLKARDLCEPFRAFPSNAPFAKLDAAVEKLRDIAEMIVTRQFFMQNIPTSLPGQVLPVESRRVRSTMSGSLPSVNRMLKQDEEAFGEEFDRFKTRVRNLELQLGALCEDTVRESSIVSYCVTVMSAFHPFKERRYFKPVWIRCANAIEAMFLKELQHVSAALDTTFSTMATRLAKGLPICANCYTLGRGLLERAKLTPKLELIVASDGVRQESEALCARIVDLMNSHISMRLDAAAEAATTLEVALIDQHAETGEYSVMICPVMTEINKEVAAIRRQKSDFKLLPQLDDMHRRWASVRWRQQRLEQIVNNYNSSLKNVPEEWGLLLEIEVQRVEEIFSRACRRDADYTPNVGQTKQISWWGGVEVENYISSAETAVADFEKAVSILRTPIAAVGKAFDEFDKSDDLFPFDADSGNRTLRLSDEWGPFYAVKRKERRTQLSSITTGLISHITAELNEHRPGCEAVHAWSEGWLDFSAYVAGEVRKNLRHVRLAALKRFKQQLSNDTPRIPMISFSLILEGQSVVFHPARDQVRQTMDMIKQDILQYPYLVQMADFASHGGGFEVELDKISKDIDRLVGDALREADKLVPIFAGHANTWTTKDINQQYLDNHFKGLQKHEVLERNWDTFSNLIMTCVAAGKELRSIPSAFTLGGWLLLSVKPIKTIVAGRAGSVYRTTVDYMVNLIDQILNDIEGFMKNMNDKIALVQGHNDTNTLYRLLEMARDAKATEEVLPEKLNPLLPTLKTLQKNQSLPVKVLNQFQERIVDVPAKWKAMSQRLALAQASVTGVLDREVVRVLQEFELHKDSIAAYIEASQPNIPSTMAWMHREPYTSLSSTLMELNELVEKEAQIIRTCDMLDLGQSPSQDLVTQVRMTHDYKQLWDVVYHIQTSLAEWQEMLFRDLRPAVLASIVASLDAVLLHNSNCKIYPLYQEIAEVLSTWKATLPLFDVLCAAPLKDRHWVQLLASTKPDAQRTTTVDPFAIHVSAPDTTVGAVGAFVNSQGHALMMHQDSLGTLEQDEGAVSLDTLRVKTVMGARLGDDEDMLEVIIRKANEEQMVEDVVTEISERWTTLRLPTKWAGGALKTWILDPQRTGDYIALAKNDQFSLGTISRHPGALCNLSNVFEWLVNVGRIQDTLESWLDMQHRWLTVVYATSGARQQVSVKELEDAYKAKIAELQLDERSNLLEKVSNMNGFLQQKQGLEQKIVQLEELLRSNVSTWVQSEPRFGTIPFNDLIRIFSCGHVPEKALSFFWMFSAGCQRVRIRRQTTVPVKFHTEVTGVASACGSNELTFSTPFECKGDVLQYFAGLLNAVRAEMKESLKQTWVNVHSVTRWDWCVVNFTQLTSITARLAFTTEVEAAFNQLEDGNMAAMKNLHEMIKGTIDVTVKKIQNFGKDNAKMLQLAKVILHKDTADIGAFSDPEAAKNPNVKKRLICLLLHDMHHRDVVQQIVDQRAEHVGDFAWISHPKMKWDDRMEAPYVQLMVDHRINFGMEFTSPYPHGVPHVITPQTNRCRSTFLFSTSFASVSAIAGGSAVGKTSLVRDLAESFGIHCVTVTGCMSLSAAYLMQAFESTKKLNSWLILARIDDMPSRFHFLLSQQFADLSYDKCAGRTESVVACTLAVDKRVCQIPEVLRKQCRVIAMMPIDIGLVSSMILTALGLSKAHAIAVKLNCYYQHISSLALRHGDMNYPTLKCLLLDLNNRRHATNETHATKGAIMHSHIHTLPSDDAALAHRVLMSLFPNENEDFMNLTFLPPAIQKLKYSGGKGNAFASACVRFTTTANLQQAMCVFGPPGCGKSALLKVCIETMELEMPRYLYPAAMSVPDFLEKLCNVEKQHVLVLDGAPGPWLEGLAPQLAEGYSGIDNGGARIFIETTGLGGATPGIISRLGVVSVGEQDVGWLGVKDRWITSLPTAYKTSIDHLCDAHFASVFEFRRAHLPHTSNVNLQETIQITLEAIIFRVNSVHDIANSAFACAVLWSLSALVSTPEQEQALIHWWKSDFPVSYAIPELPPSGNPLETFLPTYESFFEDGDVPERMQSTLESKRDVALTLHQKSVLGYVSLLHTAPRSILYIGDRGTGKTSLLSTVTTGNYRFNFVSGTARTTMRELSCDGHFDRHTVITLDDVNVVPTLVTETMRGWLETKFGFAFFCSAVDGTFNPRLARQMTHIYLTNAQDLWTSMLDSVVRHYTGPTGTQRFTDAVQNASQTLPALTMALAKIVDGRSFFITRSVTDVVRAVTERMRAVSEKVAVSKVELAKQWQYACRRVLVDALQEGAAVGALDDDIFNIPCREGLVERGELAGAAQTHYIASRILQQTQDSQNVFKGNKKKLAAGLDAKVRITHNDMLKVIEGIPNTLGGCFYHGRRVIGEGTAALHVARVADLLCSSSTLVLIHGGMGVGKQTVALLAARICGLQPTIYDGHSLDLKHCQCLIVKESRLRSNNIFHILTAARHSSSKKTRQLKVILLCSTSASTMPLVAREYPAFFVGMQLYFQAPMSPDTLTAMARRVLHESKHFGDAKIIGNLAAYCTKIHHSAKAHARGFSVRTFFDMLWLMIDLVDEMIETDRLHKRVVQEGLEKLRDASGQVGLLQERLQADTAAMSAQGRMTKKLQEKLELAKRALNEHKALLMVEENAHRTANDEHKKLLREHAKALEQMKPLLEKAQAAIKAVDKTMVSDLRSIAKPSPDIIHVCAAAVALSCESKNVNRDKSWNTLKKMMVMPSQFLQPLIVLDVKSIVPMAVDYVSALMRDPKSNFNPTQLAGKSTACMYICTWVLTMMNLYECRMAVKPTEDRMVELKGLMDSTNVELKKLRDRENFLNVGVGTVAAELRASEDKQQRLRHSIFESQARLGRMNALMESLGRDGDWTSTKITELKWGLGDVALAASLITHGAALTDTVREQLVRREWIDDLTERDLPVAQAYLPLIKPSVMARWERSGLPSYKSAHESAYAVTKCRRYPLLLDPHNQGTDWVKNHYKNYLITAPSIEDCTAVIKKCVKEDTPLLITNIHGEFDPTLDELLERSSSKLSGARHRKIHIEGEEYTIGENFRLICTTPTVHSELPEKLLKWFTVVSFDISREGLEELLLSAVVTAGNADLEMQHQRLIEDMNQRVIDMEEAENCLLSTLSGADTDLIDRPEIITAINKMKTEAAALDKASQQSQKRRETLVKKREKHRRSIRRAVLFFMEGQAMEKIKRIYAFSINLFVKSFSATYAEALKQEQEEIDAFEAEVKGSNDESIAAMATKTVYMQLATGLLKQDRLFFAASFCISVMSAEEPEIAPPAMLPVLIDGPPQLDPVVPSRVPYLSNDVWSRLLSLEGVYPESFRGLTSDVVAYPRWAQWYAHPTAETEAIPGEWQALSSFKKLLIIRALRPDRFPGAMAAFVQEHLGEIYVNPPSPLLDLKPVLLNTQFLIMWTSARCDPSITIKKVHAYLAARPSLATKTFFPSRLECLDLCKGEDTLRNLRRLASEGGSCFLESVHLYPTLLTRISDLLSTASREGFHPQFQFIATADPDQAELMPIDLIRRARKICVDGNRGLKAVLAENWGAYGSAFAKSASNAKGDYDALLFLVVYMHSVCQVRNMHPRSGFCRVPYSFSFPDDSFVRRFLEGWLGGQRGVPIHEMRMIVTDFFYELQVHDPDDRAIVGALGKMILSPQNRTECGGISIVHSPASSIAFRVDQMEWSESDELERLALTPATLLMGHVETADMCAGMRQLAGLPELPASAGDGGHVDVAYILEHLPPPLTRFALQQQAEGGNARGGRKDLQADLIYQAKTIMWVEELKMFNALHACVHRDLTTCSWNDKTGIMGDVARRCVPERWLEVGFDSELSLAGWFKSLLARYQFLKAWESDPVVPPVVMMHLLMKPMRFLFYTLLNSVRPERASLESYHFAAQVSKKSSGKFDTPARNGVHVWGIQLLFCSWDAANRSVEIPPPTVLSTTLPILTLRVVDTPAQADAADQEWECALYTTTSRKCKVLSFPLPTPNVPPEQWTLWNACAVLEHGEGDIALAPPKASA